MVADPDVKNVLSNLSGKVSLCYILILNVWPLRYVFIYKLHLAEIEGRNFYNIEVAMALLHFMSPTTVYLQNKKRYRPTIESSKCRLLQLVDDESLIGNRIKLVLKDRQEKQLKLYPLIFGIGESNETVEQFVLKFSHITLKFDSIVEAFDAAFKLYLFFKIEFPPEHQRFWAVINCLFYKIETPLLLTTPAILSSVQSFEI